MILIPIEGLVSDSLPTHLTNNRKLRYLDRLEITGVSAVILTIILLINHHVFNPRLPDKFLRLTNGKRLKLFARATITGASYTRHSKGSLLCVRQIRGKNYDELFRRLFGLRQGTLLYILIARHSERYAAQPAAPDAALLDLSS